MRRQGIVGPVAMITVGVLFMVRYFTFYSFRQTWPILLIAIGVAMIVERYFLTSSNGYPQTVTHSTSDKVNHV